MGAKMNPAAFQIETQHCPHPTDLCIMQCALDHSFTFHSEGNISTNPSVFGLPSSWSLVSLARGQRELQDSCCWHINVLNETWDWAAGIEDHHWKTLTYAGVEIRFLLYLSGADALVGCFYSKTMYVLPIV